MGGGLFCVAIVWGTRPAPACDRCRKLGCVPADSPGRGLLQSLAACLGFTCDNQALDINVKRIAGDGLQKETRRNGSMLQ